MSKENKEIPNGYIDISGLDKIKILMMLWNGSHCQGMSFMGLKGTPMEKNEYMDYDTAKKYWDEYDKKSFDYLGGHILKVDLSEDFFDPYLYDRDVGDGAAKKIVDQIRFADELAKEGV